MGGLSPRVRGNLSSGPPLHASPRSIPAGAGEPALSTARADVKRVYPRGCGGTRLGPRRRRRDSGLSPRVRGNHHDAGAQPDRHRSIPAGAGEPSSRRSPAGGFQVYPRGCGGTRTWAACSARVDGLSPRVRGNPYPSSKRDLRVRSIPAGAGEPPSTKPRVMLPPVYPRGCGGTHPPKDDPRQVTGLSPRVRGNQGSCRR